MTSAMDIEGASRAPLTRHRRRVRIATGSLAATVGAAWVVAPPDDPLGISAFVGVTAAAITLGARTNRALRDAQLIDDKLRASVEESCTARARLADANQELRERNAQVVATHVAFSHLLDLADDRTGGRLRMIVEDTGEELADMLFEKVGRDGGAVDDDPPRT